MCKLCHRDYVVLSEHHLIPKMLHRKLRKKYKKDVLNKTITVCVDCHRHIHVLYTEKELFRNYHTLELILNDEAIQKFIKFARKR